jgi:hypothetical protein
MDYPAKHNNYLSNHAAVMDHSYRKLLGKDLILGSHSLGKLGKALFYAPFVVVSHDTADDPVFNYANLKALELFGFSWEEFTRLPSRLSAEPIHQVERDKLLVEVSRRGYLDCYQGVRIAKNGVRFLIKNATVWNLLDNKGQYAGQAARFGEWHVL